MYALHGNSIQLFLRRTACTEGSELLNFQFFAQQMRPVYNEQK